MTNSKLPFFQESNESSYAIDAGSGLDTPDLWYYVQFNYAARIIGVPRVCSYCPERFPPTVNHCWNLN